MPSQGMPGQGNKGQAGQTMQGFGGAMSGMIPMLLQKIMAGRQQQAGGVSPPSASPLQGGASPMATGTPVNPGMTGQPAQGTDFMSMLLKKMQGQGGKGQTGQS